MAERWGVFDRRTGERSGVLSTTTREMAEAYITMWQDRHERGGRPDIPREKLLNLEPRLLSSDTGEA